MANYTLGGYVFEKNPGEMDIPESKKETAEVKTHGGSELFHWDATIKGQQIVLKWSAISMTMYEQLRTLYLSNDEVTFDPDGSYTYEVVVTDLSAKYLKYYSGDFQYVKDVKLTLNIRSSEASS